MTMQVRPGETPEQRQALMLMGYLRWQNATLTHASGDVTSLLTAAARIALSTAEDIGEEDQS